MCCYDIPLCLEDRKNLAYDLRDGKITPDEFNRIITLDREFTDALTDASKVLQPKQIKTKKVESEPIFEKIEPDKPEPKTMSNEELKKTISLTENEISLIVDALKIFKGDVKRITTNSSIAQCFTNSLVDNISTLLEKLYSIDKE